MAYLSRSAVACLIFVFYLNFCSDDSNMICRVAFFLPDKRFTEQNNDISCFASNLQPVFSLSLRATLSQSKRTKL